MTFRVVTPPTSEPITLTLARTHLRLVPDDDSPPAHPDDAWLTAVGIPAAREYCEHFMARAIAQQTVEVTLDAFPDDDIQLPGGAIVSVTSVKYIDEDEVERTMSSALYSVDSYQEPGWLGLTTDATWPAIASVMNAVKVRYVVGYAAGLIPARHKAAMLLVLGHLYEHREQTTDLKLEDLPLGLQALLVPDQLRMSMA